MVFSLSAKAFLFPFAILGQWPANIWYVTLPSKIIINAVHELELVLAEALISLGLGTNIIHTVIRPCGQTIQADEFLENYFSFLIGFPLKPL